MRIFQDVFYLFAPPLFANPSSCCCSGKLGQKNGGAEKGKGRAAVNFSGMRLGTLL